MRYFILIFLLVNYQALSKNNTLSEAQKRTAKTNSWIAEENEVSTNGMYLGLQPDSRVISKVWDQSKTSANLPKHFDWRNHLGKNWISPIKSQGRCGSCVAFATVGLLEAQFNITMGQHDYNPDFSEEFVFNRTGTCVPGSNFFDAFNTLQGVGVSDEACSPYVSGRLGQDGIGKHCSDIRSRLYKIENYYQIPGHQIKAALQRGPVLSGMSVYQDFVYYKSGIYQYTFGKYRAGHGVIIVGYDDDEQYWIVKNSWGTNWGEDGYFKIRYNDRSGVGNSGFVINLNKLDSLVKLNKPNDFSLVHEETELSFNKLNPNLRYEIKNLDNNTVVESSLVRQASTLSPTNYEEGNYELAATLGRKQPLGKSWYTRFTIANEKPDLKVEVETLFDASLPLSNTATFFVLNRFNNIAPHRSIVHFIDTKGDVAKEFVLNNPGSRSKIDLRTAQLENGEYTIKTTSWIGDVYSYETDNIDISILNPTSY